MSDFATRQKDFGLLPFDETRKALSNPATVVIDIRRPDEIAADGKLNHANFHNIVVTLDDSSALETSAPTILADKNAPIFLYCRSGRRATKAASALKDLGYTNVMNGGGWTDVQEALAETEPRSQ